MDEIDQMLDLYNDCVRVLARLPEIPPEISEDMRLSLLAMAPERRVEETEWLKAHLAKVIPVMAEAQGVLARAKELLGQ